MTNLNDEDNNNLSKVLRKIETIMNMVENLTVRGERINEELQALYANSSNMEGDVEAKIIAQGFQPHHINQANEKDFSDQNLLRFNWNLCDEERKIRDDAAVEEAKRKEKKEQTTGNTLKGDEKALVREKRRLKIYKELSSKNEELGLNSNTEYCCHENRIARRIRAINGTKEDVRSKAEEIIKHFNSSCPRSISIAMFADKLISHCINPTGTFNNTMYSYGQLIVMVTSQMPIAMEILLAELNKAGIFTVPKYIIYEKSEFKSREDYLKTLGYREEEDGQIETIESYAGRLRSYMRLYGALIQTEINGFQNFHGIKEGWTWLVCFLKALPANYYTAVALHAFLEMAGFALNKRYKGYFEKLMDVISEKFLNALMKWREDLRLKQIVMTLQHYLETKQYLEEPKGRRLQSSLLSQKFFPGYELEQQNQYYPSDRQNYNQYYPSDLHHFNQYSSSRFKYVR